MADQNEASRRIKAVRGKIGISTRSMMAPMRRLIRVHLGTLNEIEGLAAEGVSLKETLMNLADKINV